jgi:hypothetical protein
MSSREQVERLLAGVAVEEQARSSLEATYYSGRSVLFEDTASEWTLLRSLAERIREAYEIPVGRDPRRRIAARARARASDLYDDARTPTLEYLGRYDLARRIVTWRFDGGRPAEGRLIAPTKGSRLLVQDIPAGAIEEWEEYLRSHPSPTEPKREPPDEVP